MNSYLSPAGVAIALTILTSWQLSPELRKQVADDTSGGALAAKRAWFEQGMALDIRDLVGNIKVPTTVVVGDADRVENEPGLRRELASRIRGTEFIILPGIDHLSPLEAPAELAAAITTASCFHHICTTIAHNRAPLVMPDAPTCSIWRRSTSELLRPAGERQTEPRLCQITKQLFLGGSYVPSIEPSRRDVVAFLGVRTEEGISPAGGLDTGRSVRSTGR